MHFWTICNQKVNFCPNKLTSSHKIHAEWMPHMCNFALLASKVRLMSWSRRKSALMREWDLTMAEANAVPIGWANSGNGFTIKRNCLLASSCAFHAPKTACHRCTSLSWNRRCVKMFSLLYGLRLSGQAKQGAICISPTHSPQSIPPMTLISAPKGAMDYQITAFFKNIFFCPWQVTPLGCPIRTD